MVSLVFAASKDFLEENTASCGSLSTLPASAIFLAILRKEVLAKLVELKLLLAPMLKNACKQYAFFSLVFVSWLKRIRSRME